MNVDPSELARRIVAAWNTHDLDAILEHYSEDAELTSTVVHRVLGIPDGTLRGKAAVRAWWRRVLDRVPDMRIELVGMCPGMSSLAMVQRISTLDGVGVSVYELDVEGKIRREVFHGG